jgi:hypothetical protein
MCTEECRLLGCGTVLILCESTFRKNVSLQPPAHACSSLAEFSTLKMEAIRSSEISVYTRSTRRHIPEDGILYSHLYENLKFDIIYMYCLESCVTDFVA